MENGILYDMWMFCAVVVDAFHWMNGEVKWFTITTTATAARMTLSEENSTEKNDKTLEKRELEELWHFANCVSVMLG